MNTEVFKKFQQKATLQAIPLQASLELTHRCNERCTHCYIEEFRDDPKRLLGLPEWLHVLRELRKAGTLYLILMGGEPTLSPHFFDIAKAATAMGFHVSIISNGLKIKDQNYADRMKEAGIKLATLSLYSLNPKIHDTMTSVKGSHAKLMRAIEYCDQAGIQITLNGLLTEANSRGIFDLYEWAADKGYEFKVDPNVTPKLNGDLGPIKFRARRETLLWFYRERSKRWPQSLPKPLNESADSFICNAAKGKCAVTPYGDLIPCIEIRESFGNLARQEFSEVWHSEAAQKWRRPKIKDMKGLDGHGLYSFCDHCPGMAKNENGEAFALTQYTRLVAEVKRQVYQELRK